MKLTRIAAALVLLASSQLARAVPISNQATGTVNGAPLLPTRARVNLARFASVASAAVAEIAPNEVATGSTANAFVYDVLPTIGPGDAGVRSLDLTVPAGYANPAVTSIAVAGAALAPSCPLPGASQYCATVAGQVVTILLGTKVTTSSDIRIRFTADAPAGTGAADFTSSVSNGPLTLAAVEGNADGDATDANSIRVSAFPTQGQVLRILKTANKRDALVGEVVTYSIEVRNTTAQDVVSVSVEDTIPPDFKYVRGSARLDGAATPEPTGNRPLVFDVGTVPGFVDSNSNGTVDPGEPGYRVLTYQLVVGSGAKPGNYTNTAVAKDFCAICVISNTTSATVEVRLDPIFDLGTILGKVYEDCNRNGVQDDGEHGVPNAFVALDDGTYALTDEFGRYHFPAVKPGHRMLKIDLKRLAAGAVATTDESVVVWVTPGLLVTADFGVCLQRDTESIGSPSTAALAVRSEHSKPPVEVQGSAEALSLLVNGSQVPLPVSDARLEVADIPENIRLQGGALERPARFDLDAARPAEVKDWVLSIHGGGGDVVKAFAGTGAPPASVSWDGKTDDGRAVTSGEVYAYQLEVRYRDGSVSTSPRRLIGIDRTKITALNLLGEAFESGKAVLSEKAKSMLDETATAIRLQPEEKILIEGHTDWVGSNAYNMGLSRARAESALAYLVQVKKLPASQFVLAWYGEEHPLAPNDTPEGRMLNRRVTIQGQVKDGEQTRLLDQYRSAPDVRVNGRQVEVGERGRFETPVDGDSARIEVSVTDPNGRSARTQVAVPTLSVEAPAGQHLLPYGGSYDGCTAGSPSADDGWPAGRPAVVCRLRGHTEPQNRVEVDGQAVPVDAAGAFSAELPLQLGANATGIVVRNADGLARIANVTTQVADRTADGNLFLASAGVANLSVELPPKGVKLSDPRLEVRGSADPGGTVRVNGQTAPLDADGRFQVTLELPRGRTRLVVEVVDAQGRSGKIEREIEVAKNEVFLLAFAEGTVGKLSGKGYLEGAGLDEADHYYSDGRLAYYLKGVISGKYLITSAFDSAKDSKDALFGDLNGDQSRRLLTNLDPDKYYPVYGDSSTTVYDVQSHGKFYLALDSDTIHAVVGNYPLSLDGTELAAYRRTFYGARFAYQSVSRTEYGDPDTQVVLFGAELEQEHVHDELRATGGALYYLSRRDVIEGSQEITLVVRDKTTGLQLSATRQTPNVDYVVKYEEGRVMFQRPVQSVQTGGSLVDSNILSGNPVFVLVDYESHVSGFDKTAEGGRFRQQIGDHFALGGTYVKDEPQSGRYELQAADAEVRFGKNSRVVAETASSSGTDSLTNLSEDGGLSYTSVAASGVQEGSAWKAAADLDVGEWFGNPDRYRVRAYFKELEPGFISSGNFQEQGTQKMGVDAALDVTDADSVHVRADREERTGGGPAFAGATETTNFSALWSHTKLRWGFSVEYFDTETTGAASLARTYAAGHFWSKLGEKLTARIEQQTTLSGPDNDQTTLGVEYQALPSLALEVRATDGDLGRSAQAGAVYTLGETSVYLSERLSDDAGGEKTTTVLGAKSPVGKDTKVYTEYQWEDADTGGRTLSLVGLQRQWNVGRGLRFLLSGENADVSSPAGDASRSSVSAGVAYANDQGLSASTRQELRWEEGVDRTRQYFTVNQLDYKFFEDLTLLARFRYGLTEDRDLGTTDARLDEKVLGLAYRPVLYDRFNALFKYTSLLDLRPLNLAGAVRNQRKMDVFSIDTAFRVTPRVEWLTKQATRVMEEEVAALPSVRTSTYLLIQRFNFKIWKPIGFGVEYRVLGQNQADDLRQGWLTEAMWEFMRNFGAGIGYNFTDFSDDVFSQNDYRIEGWYFRVQAKY